MQKTQQKNARRVSRHARIRAKVSGTAARPRLAVFRSNRYVYAQLINDDANTTLASVDSRQVTGGTTKERAVTVGKEIAKKAAALKIDSIVFDRGGFPYQGMVAALADGAREGGLKF